MDTQDRYNYELSKMFGTHAVKSKIQFELDSLDGWYGDEYTPVMWRVDNLSNFTLYRVNHLHDIDTNRCVKNRAGVNCGDVSQDSNAI